MERARHILPVTETELAELIRSCPVVDLAFGTGGCALTWRAGDATPDAVRMLAQMRGVTNENTEGAGI